MSSTPRLLTARFLMMCGFSFSVFLAALQLLPTAPFHIVSIGGSKAVAGMFLGLLTYVSALSAPVTGSVADRIGRRRVLLISSVALTTFSVLYALVPYQVMLVVPHGLFWSGLLTAAAAYTRWAGSSAGSAMLRRSVLPRRCRCRTFSWQLVASGAQPRGHARVRPPRSTGRHRQ